VALSLLLLLLEGIMEQVDPPWGTAEPPVEGVRQEQSLRKAAPEQ
jgi:hypothetical protein